jgi:hypothetical protein
MADAQKSMPAQRTEAPPTEARIPRAIRQQILAIVVAMCTELVAVSAQAQPPTRVDGRIRIASWDLRDAVGAGVIVREEPIVKRWRNTFGAERRVRKKQTFAGDRLGADIVLLQGISSVREARQVFPARDWKLVYSRQVLKFGGGSLGEDTTASAGHTITAVAVRYQRRLRVTGLEHLNGLGDGQETTGVPEGAGDAVGTAPREKTLDGLAVRLAYAGSTLWVASVELPASCRQKKETCGPADQLAKWADDKRSAGTSIVMGGRLEASLRQAGPGSVCANQEIVADRKLQAETGADAIAGCVAFVDVGER